MSKQKDGNGWLWIGLASMTTAIFGALASITSHIGPAAIAIWVGVLGAAVFILRGPVGHAIGRRIEGGDDVKVELPPEVYAELDELRERVAELEERQDFAERLLTQPARSEQPQ